MTTLLPVLAVYLIFKLFKPEALEEIVKANNVHDLKVIFLI